MKKGKILALAAILSCCSLLAGCGSESSSADPSSSAEPSSAEPSSEEPASSESDSSEPDSSEPDSSEPDSSDSSDDENMATVSYVSSNPDMIFGFVRYSNSVGMDDDRIVGSNGSSFDVASASVEIGSYVYIENLGAAADYAVSFEDGSSLSGSLEAYGDGVSDPFQITGNCTITLSASSSESGESGSEENMATITYVSTNPQMYYAFICADDDTLDDNRICGSNGSTYDDSCGSIAVGSMVYIENIGAAIDYVVKYEDGSTLKGSLAGWGGDGSISESFELLGNCTVTLNAEGTNPAEASASLSCADNYYAYVFVSSDGVSADTDNDDVVLKSNYGDEVLSATLEVGSMIYIQNLHSEADFQVSFEDGSSVSGTLASYGDGISELIEVTGNCSIDIAAPGTYVSTASQASISLSCDSGIYAYVFAAPDSSSQPDEDVLLGNYNNYNIAENTVDVGSYIYIQNLSSAASYTVTFESGDPISGSLDAWGGYSDNIEVTGNCSIVLSAAA